MRKEQFFYLNPKDSNLKKKKIKKIIIYKLLVVHSTKYIHRFR